MALHRLQTVFCLGYHGCDEAVAEQILQGQTFRPSENNYDWLGHGIYFWEANPKRGLDFAREVKSKRPASKITKPTVIGAIIDLGLCLDLTTLASIEQVRIAYSYLKKVAAENETNLPKNKKDGLRRHLDCSVIEALHDIRREQGEPSLDSVKGIFIEGSPIYETAGFFEKTHIQICVRNPDCIKGVFRVANRFLD